MSKRVNSRGRRAVAFASNSAVAFQLQTLEQRTLLCAVPDALFSSQVDHGKLAGVAAVSDESFATSSLDSWDTSAAGLPLLNSNPGAFAKLLLDFDGRDYSDYANGGWDTDGDPTTFNLTEQTIIVDMWQRTAEKFAPFHINVTTVDPGNINDRETGVVLIKDSNNSGGGAPLGGFYGPGEYAVVSGWPGGGAKTISDIIAHEAGHLFGMHHQSLYNANGVKLQEYYSGNSLRAPIMGSPYFGQRGMWWLGPNHYGPNVIQDDLAYLSGTSNAFGYRPDDHGNAIALADPLEVVGNNLTGSGIIEKMDDQDVFWFFSGSGAVDLYVNVSGTSTTLDASATLYAMQDGELFVVDTAANASLGEHVSSDLGDSAFYFLVVEGAGNYGDVGTYTISGTFPGMSMPIAPPTNMTATPISASRVDLSWQDNSSNETGFRIERTSNDGINWSTIGTTGANATSFSDLTASAGATYYYRVYATSGIFGSDSSNLGRATITFGPSNVQVLSIGYTKVTLTWDDADGEAGYLIERSTDGVNWTPHTAAPGDAASFEIKGLSVDTTYQFRVRTTTEGYSLPSNSVTAHTNFLAVPDAPALAAAPYGPYSVSLSWNVVGGEDQYRIERSFNGVDFSTAITLTAGYNTSWQDYVNQPDTTVYYRIAAHNEAGWGAFSSVASAHTDPLAPPSAAPTNLRVDFSEGLGAALTWDDNANNEDDYRVERYDYDNGEWVFVEMAGEPDYPYHYTSVDPNTTYTYRVIAVNSLGESAPSNELTFTSAPAAPGNVTATASTPFAVQVTWSDVAGESGYKIQRRLAGQWLWDVIGAAGADQTSFTDTTVSSGASYQYSVVSTNGYDSSPTEPPASVTVPPGAPAAVSSLTATALSTRFAIVLAWNDVAYETNYRIERSSDGGSWSTRATVGSNVNSYTDEPIPPGATWHYRVVAYNGVGEAAASPVASATGQNVVAPAAPTSFATLSATQWTILMGWQAGSNNVLTYELQWLQPDPWGDDPYYVPLATFNGDTTSYEDGEERQLREGEEQSYRIRATNAAGASAWVYLFTQTLPSAPFLASAVAVSDSQIDLVWNNTSGQTGYRVERSLNGTSGWTVAGTTVLDDTTFSDTGRSAMTTYYYRVIAQSSVGDSDASNVRSATTLSPQVPAQPTGLAASSASATQINLTWNDVTTETSYRIERSLSATSGFASIGSVGANTTTFADTTAAAGTTYWYRVVASNGYGDSTPSAAASATTVTLAPSGLLASAVSSTQIDLTWNDVAGETGYRIERSTDGVNWAGAWSVAANITSFSNTGLLAGTTYQYRVIATNAGGDSAASNTASASTPASTPAAPTNLAATALSATSIRLNWNDNAGNESGYRIERSANGTSGWTQIATVGANVTTYTNTGLKKNTRYYFRVVAYNAEGTSPYSNVANATTLR